MGRTRPGGWDGLLLAPEALSDPPVGLTEGDPLVEDKAVRLLCGAQLRRKLNPLRMEADLRQGGGEDRDILHLFALDAHGAEIGLRAVILAVSEGDPSEAELRPAFARRFRPLVG